MGDHADPIPDSPPPPISNPSANALLPTSLPTASHDENDWPDMLFPVVFTCGLLDILYTRYGFLNPGPKSTTTYANNFDWNATRSILGLFSDAPLVRELLRLCQPLFGTSILSLQNRLLIIRVSAFSNGRQVWRTMAVQMAILSGRRIFQMAWKLCCTMQPPFYNAIVNSIVWRTSSLSSSWMACLSVPLYLKIAFQHPSPCAQNYHPRWAATQKAMNLACVSTTTMKNCAKNSAIYLVLVQL